MKSMEVLERWLHSPAGDAFNRGEQQKIRERRVNLVTSIEKFRKHLEREACERNPQITEARERLNRAEKELEQARADLQDLQTESFGVSVNGGHQLSLLENELRSSADPQIDEFLAELWEIEQKILEKLDTTETLSQPDRFTGRRHLIVRSNATSISKGVNAIREIRKKAEALKLAIIDDVEKELLSLKRSIPEIDGIERFEYPIVNPLAETTGVKFKT